MIKLTKRDALAALAGLGMAIGLVQHRTHVHSLEEDIDQEDIQNLLAVCDVIFPRQVETTPEFVKTFVIGRIKFRPNYQKNLRASVSRINQVSNQKYGKDFYSLLFKTREKIFREMALDQVSPDPDGPMPNKVRYYVINELLFALYTSPIGGQLLGNENPIGYAGGLDAYQQAPRDFR